MLNFCRRWKASVQAIPSNEPSDMWGPTFEELLAAPANDSTACESDWIGNEETSESDIDDMDSDEDEVLESIAFTEIYNYVDECW